MSIESPNDDHTQPGDGAMPPLLMVVMAVALLMAGYGVYMMASRAPSGTGVGAFVRACVQPETPRDERCRSKDGIRAAWGVDVDAAIEERRALMVATVRRMVNGELTRRGVYDACVMRGECAPVPLLPAHVDPAAVEGGNDYLETRVAFWQLSEDTPLTPEICGFMDICRAMTALGVVNIE